MTLYLADSSIWGWANSGKRPDIQAKFADRFQAGEILTCAPVALEVMHRARGGDEYEQIFRSLFEPLDVLPLAAEAGERAVEAQHEMAGTSDGNHLRPAVDYLIAAIAEAAGSEIVLWCFDRDLEIICEHTGQRCEPERSSGPRR